MSPISSRLFWFIVLTLIIGGSVWSGSTPVAASPSNNTYQTLPFSQNWSNIALITANDDWSGVPGIIGYRGDDLAPTDGYDPQLIVGAGTTVVDVNANQTNPDTFSTGGATEFHITNPVVALAGSGTADAPFLLIHINTTGAYDVQVCYNLRDIDGSTDNAIQRVALQYRVGESNDFTNLPTAYVGDATTGPSQATLVTPISITLPDATDNQSQVQLRIITTNAAGNDEWVGIDDIRIGSGGNCDTTSTPTVTVSPTSGDTPTPTNTPTVTNTPTATNTPTPPAACGSPATFIHAIQGSGTASPMTGTVVSIEGLVVGDFQASTEQSGFYVMEEPADFDANPATSEGIFVFNSTRVVNVGDKVRVTGTVLEFTSGALFDGGAANMTELGSVSVSNVLVCSVGNTVTPVDITLPETVDGELEQYEGMLVRINQTLTVSQNYFLGRYGQMTLSVPGGAATGRMYNANNGNGLGDSVTLNPRRFVVLDDGRSGINNQNANPVPHLPTPFNPLVDTIRAGDTIPSLVGVLENGKINSDGTADYRIHPTQPVTFTPVNLRTAAPDAVGGTLRVSGFNVLNYFNGDGAGNGFPTSRGASTLDEFNRQRAKIIAAIVALNPDVVGLLEMEKDGNGANSAIQDLVNGLNAATAPGTYAFITEPAPGTDEIKVSILYKPAKVTPLGAAQNYQTNAGGYSPLFDRPPLAQAFTEIATGETFVYVINHFKSKRCDGATGADVDLGGGIGCYNNKRTVQAQELYNWIASTWMPIDPDILVMGDLNAYTDETPVDLLEAAGLTELANIYVPAAQRYSFIFDGEAGELDHGLASQSLTLQTTGATIWHINADEPTAIDYDQDFNPSGYYAVHPYRSSDHDPLLIGLNLRTADYSDSPTTFGIAYHTTPHLLWLGGTVDNDSSANNGDDDGTDDGVSVVVNHVNVQVTGPGGGQGWLTGWADLNNDGLFASPAERIVNQLVTVGPNTIPLASDLPTTSLRFRFRLYESSSEPFAPDAATPTGGATGGEVEDFTTTPLAAELSLFEANAGTDGVQVRWETASEAETLGFNLWRGTSAGAPTEQLNGELIPAQAPGGGGAFYEWLDANVASGTTYYYWLEIVDRMGNVQRHGPVSATMLPPTAVTVSTFNATPSVLPMVALMGGFLLIGAMVLLRHKRLD